MDPFAQLARQGAMIQRLAADSRRCAPGVAFFAYPGERVDGRQFIPDAIARGAAAVVWEAEGFAWRPQWRVANAAVPGLRSQAGALAHQFYGRPSAALWTCGVTGTNGKTTCSQWIAAALQAAGVKCGVIGTLGAGFPGALEDAGNTTPDALEVHRLLAEMRRAGAVAAAMEASSHALQQDRVAGVAFDCALFTNLSHDHLDYHGSMDAYAAAKARLFEAEGLACAVLNLDDVFGAQLAQRLAVRGVRTIGYSLFGAGAGGEHLVAAAIDGARVRIVSSWGEAEVSLPALGRFNVANALGVAGALVAFGMDFRDAVGCLERLPDVPGRMQRLGGEGDPLVVVDYAHSPDALDKVLQTLRPIADARRGRLVAVFGAGGDRDRAKRAPMGAIASRLADRIVLTSDNPRGEEPLDILRDIEAGVDAPHALEPDRARAIDAAITQASGADVVLIAGKGHEATQEIAGRRLPFSDAAVARAALERRGKR
ncbi:MAG: UDP-N-acetylmuramoyl-L-alanyl-D-glutamate--2,6-diaminopimelate ligase [Betaproteobacteria bacterium]|nr:UDP-N-acetylmuramoyl-L-alanyl-D-glutamate--2,6-diaminopimelate ligase [Betaproteobacteria bacterium]